MREGGAAVFTLRGCAGFGRRGEREGACSTFSYLVF